MANPYDITSGYLGALEQKNNKDYRDKYLGIMTKNQQMQEDLYKKHGEYYGEQTRGLKLKNDKMEKFAPFIDKMIDYMGSSMFGMSVSPPPAGSSGGMKTQPNGSLQPQNDNQFPFANPNGGMQKTGYEVNDSGDEDNTQPYGLNVPRAQYIANGGLVHPYRFVDGGNIDDEAIAMQDQQLAQQQGFQQGQLDASAQQRRPAPQAGLVPPNANTGEQQPVPGMMKVGATGGQAPAQQSAPKSEFVQLAEQDPKQAESIYKKVSNFKNLSNMLTGFAMMDWINEKTTSGDMLKTMESLKQIQREGVYEAASKFVQGDLKGGVELFNQYGDSQIKADAVKPRIIKEIDPTDPNGKRIQERKVFDIGLDDGSKITLDPKQLALDTLSAKARLDLTKQDKEFALRERGQNIDQERNRESRLDREQRDKSMQYSRAYQFGETEFDKLGKFEDEKIAKSAELGVDSASLGEIRSDNSRRLAVARSLYQQGLNDWADGKGKMPPSPQAIYDGLSRGQKGFEDLRAKSLDEIRANRARRNAQPQGGDGSVPVPTGN